MKNKIKKARDVFASGDFTCVACDGNTVLTSKERGVAPLIKWLNEGTDLSGFVAFDKVVGNGAAYLYVRLNVGYVYSPVISESAYETFGRYNIPCEYGLMVKGIRNRSDTGYCPMEMAVEGVNSPLEAEKAIRDMLSRLK